ncbi:hypothetical protein CONPUDRAFT_151773 [Coniophora puteana RWD-64-598 SS2]|uniref:Uncharacterized protein n=1 Tax=Coniophora puteana (strain RWD-64-598) TaxID=741705 RepID=A0A5M3MUD7_CONPW|nr:uncharacterized protein CONPUDRAFT_151773 [Coniophora puteana RWD-64-598 SS2]EIW82716.1 hypothetical protein CONPUDRAFT_151773 [Coniophora puteana RWD-64-598 SS2]
MDGSHFYPSSTWSSDYGQGTGGSSLAENTAFQDAFVFTPEELELLAQEIAAQESITEKHGPPHAEAPSTSIRAPIDALLNPSYPETILPSPLTPFASSWSSPGLETTDLALPVPLSPVPSNFGSSSSATPSTREPSPVLPMPLSAPPAPSAPQLARQTTAEERAELAQKSLSWPGRNPGHAVQEPRRGTKTTLTPAQKASREAATVHGRFEKEKLIAAVQDIIRQQEQEIKAQAGVLNVKEERLKKLVQGQSVFKRTRQPSMRDAIVSAYAEKVNEGREKRLPLKDIEALLAKDESMHPENLSLEQKEELMARFVAKKVHKKGGVRATNSSAAKDHTWSTGKVHQEIENSGRRNGTLGFHFQVQGNVSDTLEPTFYGNAHALDFFPKVLGIQPAQVARMFDLYSTTNSKNLDEREADGFNDVRDACADKIALGLRLVTGIRTIRMMYKSYWDLVLKQKVELIGWPEGITFGNPSDVLHNRDDAHRLWRALESNTCQWVKLTDAELRDRTAMLNRRAANGEAVFKTRKPRSDKGKKRKQAPATAAAASKKHKSAEFVDEEEEDEEDEE